MEEEKRIPLHVGIIMDGNGRWAKLRGLPRSSGHKEGVENLKRLVKHIYGTGIKYVSLYAFSTENFKRSKEEVDYLMNLLVKFAKHESKNFIKQKIKVVFSGSRKNIRSDVQEAIEYMENETKDFEDRVLNICFNYGGRLEIVDAVKKVIDNVLEGKIKKEDITEEYMDKMMYQPLPSVDFIIRTSGELRTSNFLLWESAYAEYYFPEVLFPDFNEEEFDKALWVYQKRDRRFGGTKWKKEYFQQ